MHIEDPSGCGIFLDFWLLPASSTIYARQRGKPSWKPNSALDGPTTGKAFGSLGNAQAKAMLLAKCPGQNHYLDILIREALADYFLG